MFDSTIDYLREPSAPYDLKQSETCPPPPAHTKPAFPWPGGKRRLLKHILPIVERTPHQCYVEAFAGGAAVLLAKEPSKVEVLNDLNRDLVATYRCAQHHLDELVRQFRWALHSREMFEWVRDVDTSGLTDVQRAARFLFLQHGAFGAKATGQTFGYSTTAPGPNLLRLEEQLSALHLRLARVTIECLPWIDVCRRYDRAHTLTFLDPPYWETEGYGVPFPLEQYDAIAEFMRTCAGHVILSINDHPKMRQVFAGLPRARVDISYTIGKAKVRAGELLIRSKRSA